MTDFSMTCSDKSCREYVKMSIMGSSFGSSLPMIVCAALLTVIPIIGIVAYIATMSAMMLVVSAIGMVIVAGVLVFINIAVNRTAKKLKEVYSGLSGLVCSVSDEKIIVVRDNRPHRLIDWSNIESVQRGKEAFYLKCKDGMLIILEKNNVLSGVYEETEELLKKKFGSDL